MTLFTGTAPTFAAGDNATVVANLNILRDGLKAASEAWTAYTPTWTGTGTNPAIGNGTLNGKWRRLNKTVDWRIQVTMGTTTTYGTGNYVFALPTATHADYTVNMHMGNGLAFDTSAVAYNQLCAVWLSTTTIVPFSATNVNLTNLVPWTWATGDKLTLSGTYETA